MSVPTNSYFGIEQNRFEEVLSNRVMDYTVQEDPIYRDILLTSQGRIESSELGRDYRIIKLMTGGFAGALRSGGAYDDFVNYGDPNSSTLGAKLRFNGQGFEFPMALEQGVAPRVYRFGIPIRSMLGSLDSSLAEQSADKLPANRGEIMAMKTEGLAKNIAHTLGLSFYLSQNDQYRLGTVGTVTQDETGTTLTTNSTGSNPDTITITLTENTYHRFAVGQQVSFYDPGDRQLQLRLATETTSTTRATRADGIFVVLNVDEASGTVTLAHYRALDIYEDAIQPGDIVCFADITSFSATTPFSASGSQRFTNIAGINSYLKWDDNDPFLLGDERDPNNAISILDHGEHRSVRFSMSNQTLTEHELRKRLLSFHRAKKRYGQTIDCLLAGDGVWLELEKSRIGREMIDRTNSVSSLRNLGSDGEQQKDAMVFRFDGRTYNGYTSYHIEEGTLYGIKKGDNNFKMVTPPDPDNARSDDSNAGAPVRFINPIFNGGGSIYRPVTSTPSGSTLAHMTEFMEAEFYLRMQLVPDQCSALKIEDCRTDVLYSDSSSS